MNRHVVLAAVAAAILLAFALFGRALLAGFGVSLAALQVAGGLLLLLIAVDLVFARDSGGVSTTSAETAEAEGRADISVFPMATPLIAGPGTIADSADTGSALVVGAMLALVLLITWLLLGVAGAVQRLLGVTGLHATSRILGLLLAALAIQFVFDGIAASGLLGTAAPA